MEKQTRRAKTFTKQLPLILTYTHTISVSLSNCFFFSLLPHQNFLRCQNNKNNYNLVCETLQFLDCICGSTTGGLGLLGLYINEKNVALINQTLESLTEYCQGPCHENQVTKYQIWDGRFVLCVCFKHFCLYPAELYRHP